MRISTRWAALVHYTAEAMGNRGRIRSGPQFLPRRESLHRQWTVGILHAARHRPRRPAAPRVLYSVPYYNFSALTAALLGNSRTVQQGFDVFGHVHIPETPFRLIGLFQLFEPNTKVDRGPARFLSLHGGSRVAGQRVRADRDRYAEPAVLPRPGAVLDRVCEPASPMCSCRSRIPAPAKVRTVHAADQRSPIRFRAIPTRSSSTWSSRSRLLLPATRRGGLDASAPHPSAIVLGSRVCSYRLLADVVVAIHALYVGFVVFGLIAILVGYAMRLAMGPQSYFRIVASRRDSVRMRRIDLRNRLPADDAGKRAASSAPARMVTAVISSATGWIG